MRVTSFQWISEARTRWRLHMPGTLVFIGRVKESGHMGFVSQRGRTAEGGIIGIVGRGQSSLQQLITFERTILTVPALSFRKAARVPDWGNWLRSFAAVRRARLRRRGASSENQLRIGCFQEVVTSETAPATMRAESRDLHRWGGRASSRFRFATTIENHR